MTAPETECPHAPAMRPSITLLLHICLACVPCAVRADDSWADFPLSACAPGKEIAELEGPAAAVKKWEEISPYAYASPRAYAVGRCLDDSYGIKSRDEHYQWLKNAAKLGSSDAELYLAVEHFEAAAGDEKAGVKDSDHATKGMYWLRQSVAHGNADAKALLAFNVMNGTYIAKDLKHGQDLLREAAGGGSLAACEELADAYRSGELGLPKSGDLADKWRKSALDLASKLHSKSIFEDGIE